MGFRDSFGNYFSFHSWQATRERKKPVPLPQPKGIKTILRSAMRLQTFSTNSFSLTSMCSASCFSHHQHHRLSRMGPPTTSQYTKVHVDKIWSLFSFCKNLDSNFHLYGKIRAVKFRHNSQEGTAVTHFNTSKKIHYLMLHCPSICWREYDRFLKKEAKLKVFTT